MKEMFIASKNRLIYFLLLWILSIRSVTTSCDMQIPHGDMTWWCERYRQPCSYSCHDGYKEHDTVSWLQCSTYGQWIPWPPFHFHGANFSVEDLCTPKPCPTVIPKGTLSAGCKAVVGSICNFSCEVDYIRNKSVSELTCQSSTEWSSDLRSLCLRPDGQQCPYDFARGYLNLSCIREPGHTCSFACSEGYITTLSPPIITCGSNLEWNYDLGTLCKEIICPNVIEGGSIPNSCERRYKATCYGYECNPGYAKPDHTIYLTCDGSGNWVGPDLKSGACTKEAVNTVTTRSHARTTTSPFQRSELSIIGIVAGCVMGTVFITFCVFLIIQGLGKSRKRRFFGHVSSRCMGQTEHPERHVTSIVHNHNINNTGVPAPSLPYVHSFDSRIDTIKYYEPPPSYSQTQVTSKENPPTYDQVVANPSGFSLYI